MTKTILPQVSPAAMPKNCPASVGTCGNLPQAPGEKQAASPAPSDAERLIHFLSVLNEMAAKCIRFSQERADYVGRMYHMLRWFCETVPESGGFVMAWVIAYAVPDLLDRALGIIKVPIPDYQFRAWLARLRAGWLQQSILTALDVRQAPQPLSEDFFRLLRVINEESRTNFDSAVTALVGEGDVRIRASARGLSLVLDAKARAEAHECYRYTLMVTQKHSRDDWRDEEVIALFKRGVILEWVRELGAMPITENTFAFFTAWTEFDGQIIREFITEMVDAGTLKPCVVAGRTAVAA